MTLLLANARPSVLALAGDVELRAAGDTDDAPRLQIVANTGTPFRQAWSVDPVVVDLEGVRGMDRSRPILLEHDPSRPLGHTVELAIREGSIVAVAALSVKTDAAREVVESSREGFPWQASIGGGVERTERVRAGASVHVNGRTYRGPLVVVRSLTLREISVTAMGADDSTSAVAARRAEMDFDAWLQANVPDHESLTEEERSRWRTYWTRQVMASSGVGGGSGGGDGGGLETINAAAAERLEFIAAVQRQAAEHPTIAAQALRENWSLDRVQLEVLRASRPQIGGGGAGFMRSGPDVSAPRLLQAATLCLLGHDELAAKELGEQVTEQARRAGIHCLADLARAAVQAENYLGGTPRDRGEMISASFSTTSLPTALGGAIDKLLVNALNETPPTWQGFARVRDLKSFRSHDVFRPHAIGGIEKIGDAGELKHASLEEEAFDAVRLDTWGGMVSVTRQTIVDDDLSTVADVAMSLGAKCARKSSDVLYEVLLGNAGAFFDAGNGNLLTGASSALSIDSFGLAVKALREQVGQDGEPLSIAPRVLLVPPALEATGRQILNSTAVARHTEAGTDNVPEGNPWANAVKLEVEPRLASASYAGSSDTGWYVLGGPADAPLHIGFLNGRRRPVLEQVAPPANVLGFSWRAYTDLGAALGDYRAAVKSDGA